MGRRRLIKITAVLVTVVYCSLLVYQKSTTFIQSGNRLSRDIVSNIIIEPVTRTTIYDSEKNVNSFLKGAKVQLDNRTNFTSSAYNKNITLDDLFISVKTTKHHQYSRLPVILKTWFQLAPKQIWFFTDIDNELHQNQTRGHMVNTNCSTSHQHKHLCCKMSVEYDRYLESSKKWFCHFDDDNYVNVPRLVEMLKKYDHRRDWYLGRTSIYEPVTVLNMPNTTSEVKFWFATGGAGFCISRSLALKMVPTISGGKFISICESTKYPDDVTMGFVIELLMNINLTIVNEFHSHLEQMRLLKLDTFRDQISFGYIKIKGEWNVVQVPGFDSRTDPTRFLSLHCFLFPNHKFCPR